MAYAKLMEYKNKLKKKITTIALFSLLVTTTLTDQAVMTLAATQNLPDQPAAVEVIDDAEEADEAEEYQAGQIVTIDGVDYEISPVYTEDGKDYFNIEGTLKFSNPDYGIKDDDTCTIHFAFVKNGNSLFRVTLKNGSDINVKNAKTMITYKTQSQLDAEQAEADAEAVTAVETKISALKVLEGDNYRAVYNTTNESNIKVARAAYNALEERLQGSVSNYSTLTQAEEDYKAAGVLYVNGLIADIGAVTYDTSCYTRIGNAESAYNTLVNKYPELASQLNYSTIESARAEYNKKKDEYTSSLEQSTYFGDSTTEAPAQATTEAPVQTKAPGSVDNLSGYETDEYDYLQGITVDELLAAHPKPNNFFDTNEYWNVLGGGDSYRSIHYHQEGDFFYFIMESNVRRTTADRLGNITNETFRNQYTTPATASVGGGGTVFTLRAGKEFKYTGNKSGDYIQITSDGKTGWIKKYDAVRDFKLKSFEHATKGLVDMPHYATKDFTKRMNLGGTMYVRKGEVLKNGAITEDGSCTSGIPNTMVQPSSAWTAKKVTVTKSAGSGAKVCEITKGTKVSIKNETSKYFKVKVTKGKKSYTGWVNKSGISFEKTFKNKKSIKTVYLAVNTGAGRFASVDNCKQGTKVNIVGKGYKYHKENKKTGYLEVKYTKSWSTAAKDYEARAYVQFPNGRCQWIEMSVLRTKKSQALNSVFTSKNQSKKGWEYINEVRAKEGLAPLAWNDEAYELAEKCWTEYAQYYSCGNTFHNSSWHLNIADSVNQDEIFALIGDKDGGSSTELASGNSAWGPYYGVGKNSAEKLESYRCSVSPYKPNLGVTNASLMLGTNATRAGDHSWRSDHHSNCLMGKDVANYNWKSSKFDNGCMVIVQGPDGELGCVFYVGYSKDIREDAAAKVREKYHLNK